MNNIWTLAQAADGTQETTETTSVVAEPIDQEQTVATTESNQPDAAPVAPRKQAPGGQLILLITLFVLFYLILFRGPKRKQKQQNKLIESLNKNDKIMTRGGIIGTVMDVKDDEITLKIDESTNTKIKIAVGAVSRKLTDEKNIK